jgi:[acyl-carrier-protein] S-malonyltransferase
MAPAVDVLAGYAEVVSTRDPQVQLLSNRDGTVVADGREFLTRLVTQVSSPVRWDLCQQTFADLGVTGVLELPPAGTLANLARRALPGVDTLALKTPDDLDAARDFVERHAAPSPLRLDPTGSSS